MVQSSSWEVIKCHELLNPVERAFSAVKPL